MKGLLEGESFLIQEGLLWLTSQKQYHAVLSVLTGGSVSYTKPNKPDPTDSLASSMNQGLIDDESMEDRGEFSESSF